MRNLFLGMALALLAACNPVAQMEGADRQIEQFHQRFSDGDAAAIYRMTGPEFRKSAKPHQWKAMFEDVRAKLGPVKDSSQTGFNVNTRNGVTTTTISRDTTFEHHKGTEVFVFQGQGEKMRLEGWQVNADALRVRPVRPVATEPVEVAE